MGDLTMIDGDSNAHYGQAMKRLTAKQRLFVFSKVWKGATNRQACKDAGYSATNLNVLDVQAYAVANHPSVLAAIREETEKLRDSEGAASFRVLAEIRDNPTTEKKDKIRAAVELLNRSGWHPESSHTLTVIKREETSEEMIEQIKKLSLTCGLDPIKVLGAAMIEDASYEEIEAEPASMAERTEVEKQDDAQHDRENELRRTRRTMTSEQLAAHKAQVRAEKSARFKKQYRQAVGDTSDTGLPVAVTVDDDLSDIL